MHLAAAAVAAVLTAGLTVAAVPALAAPAPPEEAILVVAPTAQRAVPKGKADASVLLRRLTVRAEGHSASYERARFRVWNDADRDGQNARAEVLRAESRTRAVVNRRGTVTTGRWFSRYDGRTLTKASQVDVDHLVPLSEAWASGAWKWSAKRREAFGNDLGFGPSLVAVSKQQNRSKGDSDPAEWMPKATGYACTYVKHYIAVKARWKLSIDEAERAALGTTLATCVSMAVSKPGTPAVARLVPKPKRATPKPAPAPSGGSTFYRNCDAARAAGTAPVHRGDPGYGRHLDRDGDGVGCE